MPISGLAVVTNNGRARIIDMLRTGKSFVVDRFVVGDSGHDPSDPTLPITPDPSRDGCYCSVPAIDVAGGCIFGDVVDNVLLGTNGCPIFQCNLLPGEATGVVSSVCLIGTIVWSPDPLDPDLGTQFAFAIVNYPFRAKGPLDTFEFEIGIQI